MCLMVVVCWLCLYPSQAELDCGEDDYRPLAQVVVVDDD